MFGFAIWDRRQQTLFLARDRLGEKPLYYTLLGDGTLLFGSELKSILVHPGVARRWIPGPSRTISPTATCRIPKTIYSAIHKLPPGHTLTRAARRRDAGAAQLLGS